MTAQREAPKARAPRTPAAQSTAVMATATTAEKQTMPQPMTVKWPAQATRSTPAKSRSAPGSTGSDEPGDARGECGGPRT